MNRGYAPAIITLNNVKFRIKICVKQRIFLYYNMDSVQFWKRVKAQIKAHKISQMSFAEYLGMNPRTFQGWIYHNRIPDIETALQIAASLGVGLEYLVFGKDNLAMENRAQQVEERKIATTRMKKMLKLMRIEIKRV